MKRFWTALAVTLLAIFAATGCNEYGNTFQANTGARITSLSPSNISAGSPEFTITVTGSGFVTKTYILWNNQKLPTTLTTNTAGNVLAVSATVPASLVAKAGSATVITQNPFSGSGNNGLSNPLQFVINPPANPIPTLTSITPASVAACGSSCANASFTLDLQGTNFITSADPTQVSQVHWSAGAVQTTLVTTSVSATDIKATVPGSLIANAGAASITVFNPPSPQVTPPGGTPNPSGGGGGTSEAQTITITGATGMAARKTVPSATEETSAISADGRYVAYRTVRGAHTQIVLRDTCHNAPASCQVQGSLLSSAPDGSEGDNDSGSVAMSADARFVAFGSLASNLAPRGSLHGSQIYQRDTCLGAEENCVAGTQIVSANGTGKTAAVENKLPAMSASGRFVAYVAGSSNGGSLMVRDTCQGAARCTPQTARVMLPAGDVLVADSKPALSGDGRYLSYAAVRNGRAQIFLRDTCANSGAGCHAQTRMLSVAADGSAGNEESRTPAITADGRYVAFASASANLSSNAPAGMQIYLRDTCAGAGSGCVAKTELISADVNGWLVGAESGLPSISGTGRFVAFLAETPSHAANQGSGQIATGGANSGFRQIFIRDTCVGAAKCAPQVTRVSLQPGDSAAGSGMAGPALSADGNAVAVPGDLATLYTAGVKIDSNVILALPGVSQ